MRVGMLPKNRTMVTSKEELLAANIRKQIAYLEGLLNELINEPDRDQEVLQQIREVEGQLHELRQKMD
jgi:hypothetical protein